MVIGLATRIDEIRESHGPLCVGLDPSSDTLASWGIPDSASGVLDFCQVVLEAASTRVGIIKPQVAFFERFGADGFRVLDEIITEARRAGLAVIADAKRGDIGSTMAGYASAWLASGPLQSDALTASPYLGVSALEPAFEAAERSGSTVFVLCATSNPEAASVQGALRNGTTLPALIARSVRERNDGRHTAGLVVGATRPLTESGLATSDLEGILVLAPGFGAQGANLGDVKAIFGAASDTVIPSVSRSVVSDGPRAVAKRIDEHRRELGV